MAKLYINSDSIGRINETFVNILQLSSEVNLLKNFTCVAAGMDLKVY
jgi:hypothetical protein